MTNFQIWYYIAIFYFQNVIIITTRVNPDDVPHSVIPSLQHVETHDFGRPHPSQFLGGNDEHVTPPNFIHDKSPAPSSYDIDHPPYRNMDNFPQYNPSPSSHNHLLMNSDGTAPQLFQSSSPLLNSNDYLTHGIQTLEQNHLGNSDIESSNDPLLDSRVNPILHVISLRRKLTGHGAITGGISKPQKTRERSTRVSSTVTPPVSSYVSEQLVKREKDAFMPSISYEFVDFEPKTADGQMVMYAMNSFKLRDGRSFFTLLRDDEEIRSEDTINQKLFCLGSTTYMTALARFFDAIYSRYGYFNELPQNKFTMFWSQLRSFSSDLFPDGNNQVWLFRKSILDRFHVELNERLPAEYKPRTYNVMELLLVYSMYVNLFSAIAPAEDLDKDGRLLENQLRKAFESFIDLLIISLEDKSARPDKEVWPDVLTSSKPIQSPTKTALVWKFLRHWAIKEKNGLTIEFAPLKFFLNSIVFTWVEKEGK